MRADEYIASLPDGANSHPEALSKAALPRSVRDELLRIHPEANPPDPYGITEMVPSAWIPAAHSFAYHLSLREFLPSDEALVKLISDASRRLNSGPMYRALFAVASPRFLLRGSAQRWEHFYRGIPMKVQMGKDNRSTTFEMQYPERLVAPLIARLFASSFATLSELAGGNDSRGEVIEHSATACTLKVSWR